VSQREAARILGLNLKTIVRKFRLQAAKAQDLFQAENASFPLACEVEFDDLETFEHTKFKPLSVTLMLEAKSRRILGFEVAQMPAKGLLAKKALKKYGPRMDQRRKARRKLFEDARPFIHPQAVMRSDSNPHYPKDLVLLYPLATHQTVPGARGAVVGQGELKKLKFDPLFSLNHTFAMLRAHINRLFRKTWCTTKKPDQLKAHIALYALEHNRRIATQ
jgi:hypothetical protein